MCGALLTAADDGRGMFWSGLAKRAVSEAAWEDVGDRTRFLVARRERGSADVGIDSGPGADILGRVRGCEGVWRRLFVCVDLIEGGRA